jgi:hypothetical protein
LFLPKDHRKATPRLTLDQPELEAAVIATAIEGPATGQAGGGTPQWAGAWKVALAPGASVEITAPLAPKREGQIVTARFAANPQIDAGPPPFHPMGRNATAAGAKLREQVRQLMAEGSVNLSLAVSTKTAVEENPSSTVLRAAGGGAKTRRPFNPNLRGQSGRALLEEEVAGRGFERRIAAGRLFYNGRCE